MGLAESTAQTTASLNFKLLPTPGKPRESYWGSWAGRERVGCCTVSHRGRSSWPSKQKSSAFPHTVHGRVRGPSKGGATTHGRPVGGWAREQFSSSPPAPRCAQRKASQLAVGQPVANWLSPFVPAVLAGSTPPEQLGAVLGGPRGSSLGPLPERAQVLEPAPRPEHSRQAW